MSKIFAYASHFALEGVVLFGEIRHWQREIDSARFILGDLTSSRHDYMTATLLKSFRGIGAEEIDEMEPTEDPKFEEESKDNIDQTDELSISSLRGD